ncbi:MAG: wax ester/triacylglycerol synthase family O-acyltransferase [Solirubrobacterales bacterium]
MGETLTPLDAAFLELEEGDESAHMHIGWTMVFDALPEGGAPSVEHMRELLEDRLSLMPRFRCRLSSPRTGRFSWPSWEPDRRFDIADHVRHATLPWPGGEAELLDWLGDFYSHRLDRANALWEMTLLDGLEDGGWALAVKVHHSLVDGISGSWVATAILDAEPYPAPGSSGPLEGLRTAANGGSGNGAGSRDLAPSEGRGRLGAIIGGARAGLDVALHPDKLASTLSRSRAMAEVVVRDELIGAPHTSLNVRIGGTRRFAAVTAPLEDLKRIKRGLGGTVNDVVLAATAGGLHRLFEHRRETTRVQSVRVMVPVSVRRESELLSLGNRVSSLFVDLPVGEPNPLRRYRKTVAAAEELKSGDQAAGAEALVELAGVAPPLLHSFVSRHAFTPRLFNITVTNVPGPQMALYACGAPLRRVLPLVPIFAGHAVGVAVVSYDGQVTFGLNADRATVPDLDVFRDGIEESIVELERAARAPQVRELGSNSGVRRGPRSSRSQPASGAGPPPMA